MQIITQLDDFSQTLRGGAVSIGKFDGMHLGHALIIRRLKSYANQLQIPSVIVTFDQPPVNVLLPASPFRPICTLERKIELLKTVHIDTLVVLPVIKTLLEQRAEVFFHSVIRNVFDAHVIVEGRNFLFGRQREGTIEALKEFGGNAGILVDVVDFVQIGGNRVSSSGIRRLIQDGRIELVNEQMPQPYRMTGTVIHGDHRGRTLGFPTANLSQVQTVLPKPGVYATAIWIDGQRFASTTHVGTLPTFDKVDARIESYIHRFDGDLYGKTVHLDFLAHIRNIVRFDTADELVEQMHRDIEQSDRTYKSSEL